MTQNLTKEEQIEDRLSTEIFNCQVVMQYLNDLYLTKNNHILTIATGYFNYMYVIKIDYLTARIMRFFDPEKSTDKDNFSIEKIRRLIPNIELIYYSEDSVVKTLKEYRNKYLSHYDFHKSREDFPSYFEIKENLTTAISYLYDVLDKVREHNEKKDTQLSREVITKSDVHYYSLLINGAYINAHKREEGMLDLIRKSRQWDELEKSKNL